jgi:DNA-binding CsgD family transcriptional regulator
VAEELGALLMGTGDREAGLAELDRAWDGYHAMGAWAFSTDIQQVMQRAGAHREKWSAAAAERARPVLTEAERRVAELVAGGHTNRGAASALGISTNTVGSHLRSVFSKLGIRSRVQLSHVMVGSGPR